MVIALGDSFTSSFLGSKRFNTPLSYLACMPSAFIFFINHKTPFEARQPEFPAMRGMIARFRLCFLFIADCQQALLKVYFKIFLFKPGASTSR